MNIVTTEELGEEFYTPQENDDVAQVARSILAEVKKEGEEAVRKYTKKFDAQVSPSLELRRSEINDAYKKVDPAVIDSLRKAAKNIETFAKCQRQQLTDLQINNNGLILGQRVMPLERVGCYVPGGRYPLPSSALMSIIPAKVAGVREIIVCSPKIAPVTVVASDIAGADRVFSIGGIQAIGAMAYGVESVPKVDKIVGPGNQYVAAAKKEVYGVVGIDFIAGPSEVIILADETADAKWIAADLLAQAEHDPCARADLVTTSRQLAKEVESQLKIQLLGIKTREIAKVALRKSYIVIVEDIKVGVQIANKRAPEHLELQVKNPEVLIQELRNYGSLFIGKNAAEVFGDYCSGTNHILPTGGSARYTGGLSVRDFVKIVTYQKIEDPIPKELIEVASTLAEVEGLDAHRKAAFIRGEKKKVQKAPVVDQIN